MDIDERRRAEEAETQRIREEALRIGAEEDARARNVPKGTRCPCGHVWRGDKAEREAEDEERRLAQKEGRRYRQFGGAPEFAAEFARQYAPRFGSDGRWFHLAYCQEAFGTQKAPWMPGQRWY